MKKEPREDYNSVYPTAFLLNLRKVLNSGTVAMPASFSNIIIFFLSES